MTRSIVVALTVCTALVACDVEPDAHVEAPDAEALAHYGSLDLWPSSGGVAVIPVCWDASLNGQYASEKQAVRDAIEATWSQAAWVSFTGWGTCTSTITSTRVHLRNGTLPSASKVGYPGASQENTVVLDLDYPDAPEIGVHEFGHVLGLLHEHQHPDSPGCVVAGESFGPYAFANSETLLRYDPYSVMNYCYPDREDGELSFGDFVGIQLMYGEKDRNVEVTPVPGSDPVFFDLQMDNSHQPSFLSFEVVGAGEFDEDGDADVMFWYPAQNSGTLRCTTSIDRSLFPPATGAEPVAVGDFDGDGQSDSFWAVPGGADEVWQTSNNSCGYTRHNASFNLTAGSEVHVGDFDGDGSDDLLYSSWGGNWYFATSTGAGGSFASWGYAVVDGVFRFDMDDRIPAIGDFDGDGDDDILWVGLGAVSDLIWEHTGTTANSFLDPIFTEYAAPFPLPYPAVEPVVAKVAGDDDCDDVIFYRTGVDDGVWVGDCSGAGGIAFGGGLTTLRDDYEVGVHEDQLLLFGRL
ncbi:MAG: VCBS repeat-containing protein [Myxococcales bacterium]|nr:VCBS repeat-containing protein [Myxococcales bacterium]